MATLASKWYDRSGNVVPVEDITEVAIFGRYAPTGNEAVSWDASADLDGSIMCHIVGTKLIIVWDSMTEIPDKMFNYFFSLERITGLGSVTVIGKLAFYQCHSLKSVDLIPEKLTKIGEDAFRISSMEDVLDVSRLPATAEVGARATRSQRWGDELTAVQSVAFPKKRIFLNVPNADSQLKDVYKEVPFVTDAQTGNVTHTLYDGCSRFVLYHAWNALYAGTDKEYPDMLSWWNATLNADGNYANSTHSIDGAPLNRDYVTLGWEAGDIELVTNASQLSYILNELLQGLPVSVGIKTSSAYHAVLIIGCDPVTRKLAYVDSSVRYDRGTICWVAYEDLFIGGNGDPSEVVRKINFNLPMLAPNCSWYTQGGTTVKRNSITEIEIVREYTPTGDETASWDASADKNGSVMAYVNGTKLTIAGNGYYAIWANEDSSWAFSDSAKKDYFRYATSFNGLTMLNTSNVVTMERMFRQFGEYAPDKGLYLDISNWNVSNVTSLFATFDRCPTEGLPVDDWDVSSVNTFDSMCYTCNYLRELNFSKWAMRDGAITSYMLQGTRRLEKITLSEGFNVDNTEAATFLDTASAEYIILADGNWYDSELNAYTLTEIPSNVARTYYSSKFIAVGDDDKMVFVRNGTLKQTAFAVRYKNGKTDTMIPSEFAKEVLAM